jgi:hypothetical protein
MSELTNDLAAPIVQEVHERIANALVSAEAVCAERGYPLTELQRIAYHTAFLSVFDGLTETAIHFLTVLPRLEAMGDRLQIEERP